MGPSPANDSEAPGPPRGAPSKTPHAIETVSWQVEEGRDAERGSDAARVLGHQKGGACERNAGAARITRWGVPRKGSRAVYLEEGRHGSQALSLPRKCWQRRRRSWGAQTSTASRPGSPTHLLPAAARALLAAALRYLVTYVVLLRATR